MTKVRSHHHPELGMSLDEIIKFQTERRFRQKMANPYWIRTRFPKGFDARQIILEKKRARIFDAREIINRKKQHKDDSHKTDTEEVQEFKRNFKPAALINKNRVHRKHHRTDQPTTTFQNKRNSENVTVTNSGSKPESTIKFNTYVDYDDMSQMEADEERMRIADAMNLRKPKEQPVSQAKTNETSEEIIIIDDSDLKLGVTVRNRSRFNYKPATMGSTGYRLLVSNLHPNVTSNDIRELFADIGPLKDANIIRPGTAEVIYKSLKDAEKAVDIYHNREFDDKPMYCVLVTQRNSNRCVLRSGSRPSFSSNHPDTVDLDAVHAALFGAR